MIVFRFTISVSYKGTAEWVLAAPDGAEASSTLFYMPLPAQDVRMPLTSAQIALDMNRDTLCLRARSSNPLAIANHQFDTKPS